MSLRRKLRKIEQIKREVPFICYCCEAKCTTGYSFPGNTPIILHPIPMCAEFEKDQPMDQFLKKCREKQERS